MRYSLISGGLKLSLLLQRMKLMKGARGLGAIFTLHQVRPYAAPQPDLNRHLEITPDFLDLSLQTLQKEGYEFLPLAEVPSRLASPGERPFAVFTLDDAYINTRRVALPVFERFSAPFTVFVCKGLCERSHTMWWETLARLVRQAERIEIELPSGPLDLLTDTVARKKAAFRRISAEIAGPRESEAIGALDMVAADHGIDARALVEEAILDAEGLRQLSRHPLVSLGAHSVSHQAMTFLDDLDLKREVFASADYVESISGEKPLSFAYPYGDGRSVDLRTARQVRQAGFDLAVTTLPGTLKATSGERIFTLPRISLNGHFQSPQDVQALASGIPFRLKPAVRRN
ncbi:polysaccharide deacetylase family protein [Allorhizobium sp. BGMRC 0089]|uniref:polysaccharide deacetylase family protein n=1 Tax=Allorhizobium sonneratiae TaxID=2934936 RepID=UPI0020338D7B|nr:polysaccharide deacetylase family protein [Allorhizobium sonneratiae]MCM2294507.1 polysaccharide deacetylase family protein [Allorhizobium sonneratiae]